MFKPEKAKTVEEYWKNLPEDRRVILRSLHKFILETAPSLEPNFLYNMPGYGSFKYKNYRKETIDWPTVAIASQKNYVSIYICSLENGEYLAEKYKKNLGKVDVGKSCIRFKDIKDLNMITLAEIIKKASTNPGLEI